ncbi:MAG: DUF192 domain-containing protein [Methyloceanibacter sp.]
MAAGAGLALTLLLPPPGGMAAGSATLVLKTDSGPHSFTVELAATPQEKALGLMYRRSLPANAGMLFLYDRPQPLTMWMRNTLISLDMVFIGADMRVHRIETHTEPFSTDIISSDGEVKAVLELNAGTAAAIGLKVGDEVDSPQLGRTP